MIICFLSCTNFTAIGLCRTEQRIESKRRVYLRARILNEVIDGLREDYPKQDFDPEVGCHTSFPG